MSLSQNLTVKDNANVSVTFNEKSRGDNKTIRMATGTTLANPLLLRIEHKVTGGTGVKAVDRHLVGTSYLPAGQVCGIAAEANITLVVPRDPVYTNSIILALLQEAIQVFASAPDTQLALSSTTGAQILRGES